MIDISSTNIIEHLCCSNFQTFFKMLPLVSDYSENIQKLHSHNVYKNKKMECSLDVRSKNIGNFEP